MRDKIAETVKETLRYTVDSFAGVLSFDTDPSLSEQDNVTKVISQTSVVCSVIACVNPIPILEIFVLSPIHAKMTIHIGKLKGFEIGEDRALEVLREVVSAVGLSWTATLLASFVKLVPILGAIVYVPIIYGATWGLGRVVEAYFDGLRAGRIPTASELKDLFSKELSKGKAHGATLRRDQIDKVYEDLRRKIEERERARESAPAAEPREARPDQDDRHAPATPGKISIREKPVRRPGDKAPEDEPDARVPAGGKSDLAAGPARGSVPAAEPVAAPSSKTIGPETPAAGVPAGAVEAPSRGKNFVDELERLARLKDLGALTPEEFDLAKKKLLQG